MKSIVTGKKMQLLDKNTSEHYGVPSAVLMEQASVVFVQELFLSLPKESITGRTVVVAGTGNNGGDGIAIARLLNQAGIHAELYALEDQPGLTAHCSQLHDLQLHIYRQYGYPEISCIEDLPDSCDLLIDAVFGVGLSRDLSGFYSRLICRMNEIRAYKAAVDIPSGICATRGNVMGEAFRADLTVTFAFGKQGLYLWPGFAYCGKIVVAPIGITEESLLGEKIDACILEKTDIPALLPKRYAHSNKGTYGKLLIIAGSVNMAGAAIFAAEAAYRMGCGLVKIYTREVNRTIIQSRLPEALLETYEEDFDPEVLERLLGWASAVVMGPGLGISDTTRKLVKGVCRNAGVPMVIDADALNIFAENPDLLLQAQAPVVVTPHLGEMARLVKKEIPLIQQDLISCAQSFADHYRVTCVLKDFHTIIADGYYGNTYINLTGNSGLAKGGSGDILAGMIGSALAQGICAEKAAAACVFLHGYAADQLALKMGKRSMLASDILQMLSVITADF